jgi:imidazole glycerol-phosphate synthase subunit HisH
MNSRTINIAIVDYGSGNLHSARKAFERAAFEAALNCRVSLVNTHEALASADRIVLPGVGAFADCRAGLEAIPNMIETLDNAVIHRGVPFLGICVGQQLMAKRSIEKIETPGFDWINGDVVQIEPSAAEIKIPQIGWNTLDIQHPHPILEGIPAGPDGWHAYFVHSYHIAVETDSERIATTNYGGPVTAIVGKDNMVGTQFHPEKSQKLGLTLIANFLKWNP